MLLCCNEFWVGGPQSPFSISSSFILFFVWLPFFLKTKIPGWRPSIAFLYLFLFHSLLRLTSFLSENQNQFRTRNTMSNTCWPSSLGCLARKRRAACRKVSFLYFVYFYLKNSGFSCSRSMIEYARKGERIGREMTGGVILRDVFFFLRVCVCVCVFQVNPNKSDKFCVIWGSIFVQFGV